MRGNESTAVAVIHLLGTIRAPPEGTVGKNYVDIENDRGEMLRYRKHANGRGLVAHGAKVHPSAIVETGAYVEPGVQIAAGAHIGRGVWVERDAVIGPDADIAPHAYIGSGAAIGAGAKIGVRTHVGTGARVAVGSLIGDDETIGDGERVATDRQGTPPGGLSRLLTEVSRVRRPSSVRRAWPASSRTSAPRHPPSCCRPARA